MQVLEREHPAAGSLPWQMSHMPNSHNMGEVRRECAATYTSLSKVIVWHRQLALQLGGMADSPWLREELQERSKEAHELSKGLRNMLLARLRQPLASPEEQQELERLWVLSLSALELFHQHLHRAHNLCQLFPLQGQGVQLLSTGVTGATDGGHKPWRRSSRKGTRSREQLGAAPGLEEQIEHVGTMLLEMETRVNVPVWTVEATEEARTESSLAFEAEESCSERQAAEEAGGPGCCRQHQSWPALCCTLS
ncbi:regulator of G-protein signaling 9-binding protein-like [Chelonoidis abingdonii]|uniref:regulator of G-protein signaling 9-binding protein-like n=1 Tax=Chelonoidis abingdonii TaxID=106734 RepID=UPI0013F1BE63|nr:regulator of G-protein signaling 9-binding protein-like [Chelonoidis abingdonii]